MSAASADVGSPEWLTVQSAGSTGADTSRSVALMSDGIPVVAGKFTGTATFPRSATLDDSISLTSQGFGSAAFVGAMDAQAQYFTWAQRIAGSSFQLELTVVATMGGATPTTTDDTVIVTGYFNGTAYFPTGPAADDSIALTSISNGDAFVAAVVPDGSRFGWARQIATTVGGFTETRPRAMTIDSSGRGTLFGEFSTGGSIEFPTASAPIALPGRGTGTLFVARFEAETGYFTWAQRNVGTPSVSVTGGAQAGAGTATLTDDRPVVAGGLNPGTTYFPTGRPAPDDSIAVTTSGVDSFVAAMNTDDSYFAWVQRMQGANGGVMVGKPDGAIALAGGYTGTAYFPRGPGDDSIAITSTGNTDAYVAEMTAYDSYFRSAVSAGGSGNDQVRSIAVTPAGDALVAGSFTASMSFPAVTGPISVTNTGGTGSFVAQLAATGQSFDWALFATGGTNADSATAYGVASTPDGRAIMTGQFAGTVGFSGAGSPLSLTSRGSQDVMVASAGIPSVPPPGPVPAVPASAPRDVAAQAGDSSASVTWTAPSSSGSYPVSHYLVTSSPGGRTCLVTAPTLTCEVAGLTNGTAYTFTVKALTGAGWSAESRPSDAVVPRASAKPTIVISGTREGKRIVVTGRSTGLDSGSMLTPHVARSLGEFTAGVPFGVGTDGSITWSRRASASVVWRVYLAADGVRSNTVTIR